MIHPSASVDTRAHLDDDVEVGAFAVIGADVEIATGNRVGDHAVILGPTRIGPDNHIHAHACIGDAPQDLGYRGEPTRLEIGAGNVIREFVTIHRGSPKDTGCTRVGDGGLYMVASHIAHDCRVGDGVILANCATLAGHVTVGDHANIAGLTAVHQFVRIGRHAMIGGGSIVVQDIPPFLLAAGNHARLHGLNRRGLERHDFPPEILRALKRAYRRLFRSGERLTEAAAGLRGEGLTEWPAVAELIAFVTDSHRGVAR